MPNMIHSDRKRTYNIRLIIFLLLASIVVFKWFRFLVRRNLWYQTCVNFIYTCRLKKFTYLESKKLTFNCQCYQCVERFKRDSNWPKLKAHLNWHSRKSSSNGIKEVLPWWVSSQQLFHAILTFFEQFGSTTK